METIEESVILRAVENANKKKMEYLEADRNKEAERWEYI